jgi:hypothetical protein
MRAQWLLRAGLAALGTVATGTAPAWSIDDSNPAGLITETVAAREALRDYDGAKQYGAERVRDRVRQHVQPIGIRARNFLLFPSLEGKAIYDDNIFATPTNEQGDLRTELAPALIIKSHLPRHILNLAFDGRLVSFAEHSDQNFIDGRAAFDGALHVDHAHTLALSAMTELVHEEHDAITASRDAKEPVPIHHSRVSAGITRDVGRLYGTLSATADRYNYYDVPAVGGGTLDEDNRDNDLLSTQLRAGYRFSPGFEAVGKLKLLRQINGEESASNPDSTGYEALIGLSMESSPLLRWRLLGGYGIRDYDATGQKNTETALLEGHVEWLPTERMTIYGAVSRDISYFSGEGFDGYIETSVKGGVEYEIYNNLVLKLGAGFTRADFQGEDRRDDIYTGSIGLEYLMNKNWLFTFSYEHEERQSTDALYDMSDNRFMIGAKLRF